MAFSVWLVSAARQAGLARRYALLIPTLFTVPGTPAALAQPLTLEEAWQQAESMNPTLRGTEATLAAVEGLRRDTRAPLWNNPEVSGNRFRRMIPEPNGPSTRTHDWSVGVAQTFETAGQQGLRRQLARENVAATEALIANTRRQLHAEVEQRFVRVLSLQTRIGTEEDTLRLIESATTAVRKRVAAGEDTRLDGNVAEVEAARARNQVAQLREQLLQARANLAALLQLPPDTLPEAVGTLDAPPLSYTLEELLARVGDLPALRAAVHRLEAARSQLRLERAAVSPNITVGLIYGAEGSTFESDRLAGVTVSLPLPLFRRNAAGIGQAVTELAQREIERQALTRDSHAFIVTLWQQLQNLRIRVERLQADVLPRLEENQRLSQIAFREGEIGLLPLLLINRQVLDGRRDLLDARTELRLVRVALERGVGWSSPALAGTLRESGTTRAVSGGKE